MQRPAIADYPPGSRLSTRVLDDFELVWMLRGRASMVAEATIPLSPGHLLFVPPGVPHGFVWDPRRPSRHGYVHFTARDATVDLPAGVRVYPMSGDDPLSGLCAYLLWLGRLGQSGWRDSAGQTLDLLLTVLVHGPLPGADAPTTVPPPLRTVVDFLRVVWSHLPLRRVGIDELAATAAVSRGYLNRLFRATFDLPPGQALERIRCSRAETLLTHTDFTLARIARLCGFADLAHFSHRFSVNYGVPPSGYRAQGPAMASVLEHPGVRRLSQLVWD